MFLAETTVPDVSVYTSENGGHSNEQLVEMALEKLINVSDSAHPAIKEQANVFKNQIAYIMLKYITLARKEERATITHILDKNGHIDLANIIRRL